MNLMNCSVKHISWGIGTVTEQKENYIKISFPIGEKQFVYPDAFEKFLKCEDTSMQGQIEEEIAHKKQQEILKQQERQQKIEEISHSVPVVNTVTPLMVTGNGRISIVPTKWATDTDL